MAQEWQALRQSFRYDDYRRIASQNPARSLVGKARLQTRGMRAFLPPPPTTTNARAPPPVRLQVLYGIGDGIVQSFGAIDSWLEKSGVFPRVFARLAPREDPK